MTNRPIKFRAFDTKEGKWEYFTLGTIAQTGPEFYGRYINWCEWTGFLDKNGKEIYEGDVVRFWSTGKVSEVIFSEYYAQFQIDGHTTKSDWSKSEVIGNIYENPNLLS